MGQPGHLEMALTCRKGPVASWLQPAAALQACDPERPDLAFSSTQVCCLDFCVKVPGL